MDGTSSPMEGSSANEERRNPDDQGRRGDRESNKDAAKRSRDMKKQYLHELEAICERKCDEVKQLAAHIYSLHADMRNWQTSVAQLQTANAALAGELCRVTGDPNAANVVLHSVTDETVMNQLDQQGTVPMNQSTVPVEHTMSNNSDGGVYNAYNGTSSG